MSFMEQQGEMIRRMETSRLSFRDRLVRSVLHRYFWLARGMTLGVRALVLDGEDRVFLVRHTYISGWHLPGGGVETGETLLEALAKELQEEGNIILQGPACLHGVFFNRKASKRDHVAVFVVREFTQTGLRGPDRELAETGFFPLNALPDTTTPATRARINEVVNEQKQDVYW